MNHRGFSAVAAMILPLMILFSGCSEEEPTPAPTTEPATETPSTFEETVDTPPEPLTPPAVEEAVEEPAAVPDVVFDNLHVPSPEWEDQIIYFIMTDRFSDGDPTNNDQGMGEYDPQDGRKYSGGDLQGVIDQLDYIQGLGATSVWITPPVANQWWDPLVDFGGYHGYWTENFKEVDQHLGDLQTYQALSNALHDRGMYLIQDIVANHTGNFFSYKDDSGQTRHDAADPAQHVRDNPASVPVTKPSQSPFDRNDVTDPQQEAEAIYHWTPSIDDYQNQQQLLTYQLFDLDDLNTENPVVREALRDSYGYWIEAVGVDGFRIDTVIYVEHDFWNDFVHSEEGEHPGMKAAAQGTGRDDFFTLGETFIGSEPYDNSGDYRVASYLGSVEQPELDSVINFPLYLSAGRVFAEGLPTSYLTFRLEQAQDPDIYPNPGVIVNFIDNHDVTRFLARGNVDGLKQATMFLMTVPGIPVIYYGTEQGFTEQRGAMFAAGYGSNGQDHFDTQAPLFQHIQAMTSLRKSDPLFTRGNLTTLLGNESGPGALAYRRDYDGRTALVIFNTSDRPVLMTDLDTGLPAGTVLSLIAGLVSSDDIVAGVDGRITMELAGREGLVLMATEDVIEQEATAATVAIATELSGQLFTQNILVEGTVSEPNSLIKVILNGNLTRALETTAGDTGVWSAEVPISEFAPGITSNTIVAYAPDLAVATEAQTFETEVTKSGSRVTVYDRLGDDVGPFDTYFLPTDESFGGQMDILRTSASAFGTNLQVEVEMDQVTSVWDPANGFDHVLFHIYIDLPVQEGISALPKINASAPEGFAWDYMGIVEGWSNRLYSTRDAGEDSYGTVVTPAPQVDVDMDNRTLTFLFTSDSLGNPSTLDGAKVYITTWDWNGPDAQYRFLRPGGGQWGFGGGDWSVDPLIIDDTEVLVLGQSERLSQPDPDGDNYGPYSAGQITPYSLPTGPGFGNQLDLRHIDAGIYEDGLTMAITTGELLADPAAPHGFGQLLLHVFLDTIPEQGSDVLPRLNAQAPDGMLWDYVAVIDGSTSELYSMEGAAADAYGTAQQAAPRVTADPDSSTITLLFDSQVISAPESIDDLKIYVTAWDRSDDGTGFRPLTPDGGEGEFGGGDGSVDPLIIDDLLAGLPQNFVSQIPPTPQVEVTFLVQVPESTAVGDKLYLTGPFNQWNPADSSYQFSDEGEGLHRLTLSVDEGEFIEYRITRGSFNTAEKVDPADRFANREAAVPVGEGTLTIEIEVEGWWDD